MSIPIDFREKATGCEAFATARGSAEFRVAHDLRRNRVGIRLSRLMLDRILSGGSLYAQPAVAPAYWFRVIEGIQFRSIAGSGQNPGCRWSYVRNCTIIEGDDLVLVSEREMRRAFVAQRACGVIDWVKLDASDARLTLALVPTENGCELRVFGDHAEAVSRMHAHCERHGYASGEPWVPNWGLAPVTAQCRAYAPI